jgi:hypothetical protein
LCAIPIAKPAHLDNSIPQKLGRLYAGTRHKSTFERSRENLVINRKGRHAVALSVILAGAASAAAPGLAGAQQATPVIDSVTMREDDGGRYPVVYPEFHFHDPSGTVRFIHREIVTTNDPKNRGAKDGLIEISANQQIQGATFVGGWSCGPESYYVTLRAFMMNLDGGKSNVVEYTIHCNGG